jgi:UDPglucose 6-dehydrogenase
MNSLLDQDANLHVFDPEAMPNIKKRFGDALTYGNSMYEVLEDAEALVICTEWSIFRSPRFTKLKQLLKSPSIFEGRNLYQVEDMAKEGFKYVSIGRKEAN